MKVKTLKNIIYKGTIYNEGAEAEIDDTTAYVLEKKNRVKILGAAEVEFETVAEGLPPLEPRKKK